MIIQSPSKNFYKGRFGYKPELIVIHCTDGFNPSDLEWLKGAGTSQVSSHYYIAPNGVVHQLVADENGSWHAGVVEGATAKLLKKNAAGAIINPNYYTLGIEVSLRPPAVVDQRQWENLKSLIKDLCARHNIPIDRDHIIGHREIRATKTCPGTIIVDKLVAELAVSAPLPVPPNMVDKEELKNKIINFIQSL